MGHESLYYLLIENAVPAFNGLNSDSGKVLPQTIIIEYLHDMFDRRQRSQISQ
jgi:hypothetical protein